MIDPIQAQNALQHADALQAKNPLQQGQQAAAADSDFEAMFSKLIQDVDKAQKVADDSIKSLASGDNHQALHDVVLKLEEADLTFRLMKQIRDKLVQAYKEVISMQS